MAKPKGSEADSKSEQDAGSEAGKTVQDKGSEGDGKKVQDTKDKPKTEEEIRAALESDPEFIKKVLSSEEVRKALQSQRDTRDHELTLPLKRQIEQLNTKMQEMAAQTPDPVLEEVEQLKKEGRYQEALTKMEEHRKRVEEVSAAEGRGKQTASQDILTAVSQRPEFSALTSEDWRSVYSEAAEEAQSAGRSYITADEYIGKAGAKLIEKGKEMGNTKTDEEIQQQVAAAVEAELKSKGHERRKGGGGPEEDLGDPGGAGDLPTDEEVAAMGQQEWNDMDAATRDKLVKKAVGMVKSKGG